MQLFDTHAHYDDSQFDPDRATLLAALPQEGVSLALNPGCDPESSAKAVAMAERYPHLYAAVGWHPENCGNFSEEGLAQIRALAQHPKVKAIGEIGLDYYWDENPPKEHQQMVFRRQMALAQELGLPVIVHDREAHGDCLAIVKEFPQVRGVFHCYSGSVELATELVQQGWMLSFTGVITYKNARKALEVLQAIPLDRIMLETDSPYMAPVPCRGTRNDSRLVRYMAEKVAEIKGLSLETVARITLENGCRFFNIDLPQEEKR